MTGIVDWAAARARMVIAFIALSLLAGTLSYVNLPKEGEPDIEIPALFVSVPFPGISAEDSEKLLVKPMETELSDIDGLKEMTGTAAEGYAGLVMEFEFGWDKTKTIADVRDRMNSVEAAFPDGADNYSINEINFSEFPIIIVNLTGAVPERTLIRVAKDLQDRLEGLEPVLEASLTGHRDEMLEVVIDPLRLESYNVTAGELISVVTNNNQLIAAGEIETETGAFAVKIPSSFDDQRDIYNLPVKVDGDRVITLGDLAEIRLTFEDRAGTARFNGETTVALQVVKRKGFNLIDTAALVRDEVDAFRASLPPELQQAMNIGTSNDQSRNVASMVSQLEGSVLTAIALVMIVVLASLGARPALLVGFAIPTSFLLCFAFLAVMGVTISNIVMFGLILAVGMLVDAAIVVVEYADKRIDEGSGPMTAYVEAAKRMFWPIVSSTATTLCAFLPMLFWPGVAGEFMGMLPVTLIFVLSASLIVALIYLPVMGGVAARFTRSVERGSAVLMALVPWYLVRLVLAVGVAGLMFLAAMQTINPGVLFPEPASGTAPLVAMLPGALLFVVSAALMSVVMGTLKRARAERTVQVGYRRKPFGWFIHLLVSNPVMPLVVIAAVAGFVVAVFVYFGENNNGVEFFVETEPEQAIVYVRARGNLSLEEKDALVAMAERIVITQDGVRDIFAFAGDGGLNNNTGGVSAPGDTIGQIQVDLEPWGARPAGNAILEEMQARLSVLPGIETEILAAAQGPGESKPVNLRLSGDNWEDLQAATATARAHFDQMPGLALVEDTLPLPGIDWQIDVDVEAAGRYGADVATVGAMVQLVTRGILLDTMRVPSSDDEIDIRVRFPEEARVLSTLDTLRTRTREGLVPLSNFVSYTPAPQLAEINRVDQSRVFQVKADVVSSLFRVEDGTGATLGYLRDTADETVVGEADFTIGDTSWQVYTLTGAADASDLRDALEAGGATTIPVTANERIEALTQWLETEAPFPDGIDWEWAGDQEDQAESQAFLSQAFAAALGLMFIILLAQFNSVYNAVLVLLAVVLSTTGVLIGMVVMDQTFSIIMTGTGIVALAGIVVNNNIVLIDTYQEYSRYMPRIEAIIRTAEARIRPVLLTTITTMAGLAPMMFGVSLDFGNGGYTVDSPTALWWKQLATAVVFGLGIATVLTLVVTPSLLALRVWWGTILGWIARGLSRLGANRASRTAQDWALARAARQTRDPVIFWDEEPQPVVMPEGHIEETIAETPSRPPGPHETIATDDADSADAGSPKPPLRAAE